MQKTNFSDDHKKGSAAESLAINDFFAFMNIPFANVADDPYHRALKVDIAAYASSYDIKTYKDKAIVIEEWHNREKGVQGWFYTCKATHIIYTNVGESKFAILRFDSQFKEWYMKNKERFKLQVNAKTVGVYGDEWQSEFRTIPILDNLANFIAFFQLYKSDTPIEYPKTDLPVKFLDTPVKYHSK